MGLILILPVAGLCSWVLWTTHLRLRLKDFNATWRRSFWILALIGAAVSIWSGFYLRYHPARTVELTGFPIPIAIVRIADGKSTPAELPVIIRYAGMLANIIFAINLCTLPVSILSFWDEWRRNEPNANATGAAP